MRKLVLFTLAVVALLAFAGAAQAGYYIPRHHHACKANFKREVVKIKERRHGRLVRRFGRIVYVRQVRCVYVKPKSTTLPPPAPKPPTAPVSYSTHVDPSFTQAASNPLAVTYAYDATAIANGVNLGAEGQLPPGILNFYSATAPGAPAGLVCSLNVGGSTTGGSCLVDYSQTGTYQVTTQYVPNTASAVTETDSETISPYTTTTGAATKYTPATFPQNGTLIAGYAVDAQGLGQISPAAGSLTTTITDLATGQSSTWTVASSRSCEWYVSVDPTTVQFLAFGSCDGPSETAALPIADFADGQIVVTAAYAGMPGWAASTSEPAAADNPG